MIGFGIEPSIHDRSFERQLPCLATLVSVELFTPWIGNQHMTYRSTSLFKHPPPSSTCGIISSHKDSACKAIPWTEESGCLQSTQSQRVGCDWLTNTLSSHPTRGEGTTVKYLENISLSTKGGHSFLQTFSLQLSSPLSAQQQVAPWGSTCLIHSVSLQGSQVGSPSTIWMHKMPHKRVMREVEGAGGTQRN